MNLIDEYGSKGINRHTIRIYELNGRFAGIDKNWDVINEITGKPGMYYCFEVNDPEKYSHGEGIETIWYGTLQDARAVVESYLEGKIPHIPVQCHRDLECDLPKSGKKPAILCKDCPYTGREAV